MQYTAYSFSFRIIQLETDYILPALLVINCNVNKVSFCTNVLCTRVEKF